MLFCVFCFPQSRLKQIEQEQEELMVERTELEGILISASHVVFWHRYCRWKEGNTLFNDALNTFHLWLYGVRHMVKDHSDNERGNLLLPHGLLFPISSKGSFICTIPQTG